MTKSVFFAALQTVVFTLGIVTAQAEGPQELLQSATSLCQNSPAEGKNYKARLGQLLNSSSLDRAAKDALLSGTQARSRLAKPCKELLTEPLPPIETESLASLITLQESFCRSLSDLPRIQDSRLTTVLKRSGFPVQQRRALKLIYSSRVESRASCAATKNLKARVKPTPAKTATPAAAKTPPTTSTPSPTATTPGSWSTTYPSSGSVTIPEGATALLDVPNLKLANLTVNGTLRCHNTTSKLSTDWLIVGPKGRFECGSESQPFQGTLEILLTNDTPGENVHSMGDQLIGVMGGTIELHGAPKTSWLQLGATAQPGSQEITLEVAPVAWKVGDRIVIAPSDFDTFQTEERSIVSIQDNRIGLNEPLSYRHWGEKEIFDGRTIDMRAEVANISRSITINAVESSDGWRGGHTMYMPNSTVHIEYVRFDNLGQAGTIGRYPVHFHLAFDTLKNGPYIRGSAVTNSNQRGIVIHQTDGVLVDNNVVYNTHGNMYYLEDTYEFSNIFKRNVGIHMRHVEDRFRLSLPDQENDARQDKGAIFWISNYHTTVIGNHAAGAEHGWGFTYSGANHDVTKTVRSDQDPFNYTLEALPMLEFSNNVAHTINGKDELGAFNLGYGPEEAGSCFRFDTRPYSDEHGQLAQSIPSRNLTAYNCHNAAYWGGIVHLAEEWSSAQARVGLVCNQGTSEEGPKRKFLFVGETRNNVAGRNLNDFLTSGPFGAMYSFENTECSIADTENFTAVGLLSPETN